MSSTITLSNTTSRRTDAALNIFQLSLMVGGLLLVLAIVDVFSNDAPPAHSFSAALSGLSVTEKSANEGFESAVKPVEPPAVVLSPRMQGALEYVKRRYHVSPDAVLPVFEIAQLIGKERRIDPLLIVAIIGIESGFNPFAESSFGAQGLMQIIPRFHLDKVPSGGGEKPLLDPVINVQVGVRVLEEAIRRRGGLIPGLQYYAGSSDPEGSYASKVIAEKERLEQAARRNAGTVIAPAGSANTAPSA